MDVLQMRAVIAVVDEGSLLKAAHRLNVSVQTVKNQIDALEFEVGSPLFSRTKRGSVPTPQGLLIAERSREVIERIEGIVADARHLASEEGVKLACPRHNPQPVRDELCQAFLDRHPHTSLHYQMFETTNDGMALLEEGRANALFMPQLPGGPYAALTLGEDYEFTMCPGLPPAEYSILVLRGDELASRGSIPMDGILELRRDRDDFAVGCELPKDLYPFCMGASAIRDQYDVVNHCLDGGACLVDNYTAKIDGRLVAVPIEGATWPMALLAKVRHGDDVEAFIRFCSAWETPGEGSIL